MAFVECECCGDAHTWLDWMPVKNTVARKVTIPTKAGEQETGAASRWANHAVSDQEIKTPVDRIKLRSVAARNCFSS